MSKWTKFLTYSKAGRCMRLDQKLLKDRVMRWVLVTLLSIALLPAISFNEAQAAPPTFVASGGQASNAAAITPLMPAGVLQNDILLLFLETANEAVTVSGGSETWTEVTSSPQGTGALGTRLTVFWARASQDAPTPPPTSDSGDHQIGVILAFRGAITSGNPWDVTAGGIEATSDTSGAIPGATTTVADTLIVAAIATDLPDANGTANFSAWANANLTSVTEQFDVTRNAGNGGGLGIATGVKATAGAYGNTTVTLANATVKGMLSIALKPIVNNPPSINITQPDGVGDTVTVGASYNITYSLSDAEEVVTAAFYYDTNNTGLDGTAITGCGSAPEGSGVTCSWNTTGVTPGTYYVYGISNDGVNPQASAYSLGTITINAAANNPPSINITQPDGVGDTVTVGASYNITYSLSDAEEVVTAAFYYDTNNTGLDGTTITGCGSAPEGSGVTCSWNTTGVTPGTYYVYGISNDGVNPQASAYSLGTITINAAAAAGSLQFTSASYSVSESAGTASITVSRVGGSSGAVQVTCATTTGGTATAGSHYNTASNILSWGSGDSADKTCSVTVLNDTTTESTETVNLQLSSPTGGATLGSQSTAILYITDNDVSGDGNLLRRTNKSEDTCGGPTNACHNLKPHNATNTGSTYWTSDWGNTSTSKYGKFVCQTCHTPHNTDNIFLIRESVSYPDNSLMPSGSTQSPVDYRYRYTSTDGDANVSPTDTGGNSNYVLGNDYLGNTTTGKAAASGRPNTSTRICEVCHSQTQHHRYDTASQPDTKTHNNAVRCTGCHFHEEGFKKPSGGIDASCQSCHNQAESPIYSRLNGTSTTSYYMYLTNTELTYPMLGSGALTDGVFDSTEISSTDRRCIMCHSLMSAFQTGGSNSVQSNASNLRVSIAVQPDGTPGTVSNTEFIASRTDGGICTSCHQNSQYKANVTNLVGTTGQKNDGTTQTPIINPALFGGSSHNYTVPSATFSDNTSFQANCLKCHNEDPQNANSKMTGSGYKFALHSSTERSLHAAMSAILTDPIEERFCYNCHTLDPTKNQYADDPTPKDYYNTTTFTNTRAQQIESIFTSTATDYSRHDIANTTWAGRHKADEGISPTAGWLSTSNLHVECVDCHNPHSATAGTAGAPWYGTVFQWSRGTNNTLGTLNPNRYDISTDSTSSAVKIGPANAGSLGVSVTTSTGTIGGTVVSSLDPATDRLYQLCLKCHSYWAWGGETNVETTAGAATGNRWNATSSTKTWTTSPEPSATSRQTLSVTNQAWEFATDGVAPTTASSTFVGRKAYHSVFGIGRNRPELYTAQFASGTRNPCWCSGGSIVCDPISANHTITAAQYLSWGAYGDGSCTDGGGAGPAIGARQDLIGMTRPDAPTKYMTATLSQNFVPPWLHISTITCVDCHTYNNDDTQARGPHGAARQFLLRNVDTTINFTKCLTANCATTTTYNYNDGTTADVETMDPMNFCLNIRSGAVIIVIC